MGRRTLALFAILFLFSASPGSAVPAGLEAPVDLPNTPLSSPNVHLLATIPDGAGISGKFMGNHFFETVANPTGSASPGGLRVFDVTDPELPVLAGFMPLPHWQNENVDLSEKRKILLISHDRRRVGAVVTSCGTCTQIGGILYIIDIADPTRPMIRSFLPFPGTVGSKADGTTLGGPGHIANCVLDCNYVYMTGSRDQAVWVVDIRNLDAPKVIGRFATPAAAPNAGYDTGPGVVHDVTVDRRGYVWVAGTGGTALYAPLKDPLRPRLLAKILPGDNKKYNGLIHHEAQWYGGSTVLIVEEDYAAQCGANRNEVDEELRDDYIPGSFQTWQVSSSRIKPLGQWVPELGEYASDGSIAVPDCSGHWFSFNNKKIVAIGYYSAGVRFLDISNPRKIRQVGYWMAPGTESWAAYFVPGRPDIVYVPDYQRGLDVLKIDNGGAGAATVRAPVRAEWFSNYAGVRFAPALEPHEDFGYACAVPRAF